MEHRERLYRSREDRILFGVAGGMAEWLDQDPAIIRLLWALFFVFGGVGLVVYIIAAIVIPEEPFETPAMTPQYDPAANPGGTSMSGPSAGAGTPAPVPGMPVSSYAFPSSRAQQRAARRAARHAAGPSSGGIVFGVILILIGGWFLLRQFIPWFNFDLVWPLILVGVGVILIVAALNRESTTPRTASQPSAQPASQAATQPASQAATPPASQAATQPASQAATPPVTATEPPNPGEPPAS